MNEKELQRISQQAARVGVNVGTTDAGIVNISQNRYKCANGENNVKSLNSFAVDGKRKKDGEADE